MAKTKVEIPVKNQLHKAFEEVASYTFNPDESTAVKAGIDAMLGFVSRYKMSINDLGTELSMTDKALDRLYHAVEQQDKFDLGTAYAFTKKVQELRRERRRIKATLDARGKVLDQIEPILGKLTGALQSAKGIMDDYEKYLGLSEEAS